MRSGEVIIINFCRDLISENRGISGCGIFLLIVILGLAGLAGFLYYQGADIFQMGIETAEQAMTVIEEVEDLEDLEDIEELEELEEFEDLEIEALEDLEIEDLERIEDIAPVIRNIYARLPEGIRDIFQEEEHEEEPEAPAEDDEVAE